MKLKVCILMSMFLGFVVAKETPTKSPKPVVAKKVAVPKTGVAKRGVASDPDAPIEVRGQSRNLNMLLILQNQNEVIDFIKLRKDYQDETKRMNY